MQKTTRLRPDPPMKTFRRLAVFPFEALLAVCVIIFVATEVACLLLGQLCQLVEGATD